MEYFGEAIVQFCWLDLKMKNKKGVGYVDFLKNKKVRKIYEKIFSNCELAFSSFHARVTYAVKGDRAAER